MLVSVIVAIYNKEKYLKRCIESIQNQTYKDLDIILVDDGSTDKSLQICRKYEQEDHRIRTIHKKNGGLVTARKAGIVSAKGDYIGHIDGDDWVEATYFETLVEASNKGQVDVVIDGFKEDHGDCSFKRKHHLFCGVYDSEKIKRQIYPKLFRVDGDGFRFLYHSQWGKLIRKELAIRNQLLVDDRAVGQEDALCIYPVLLEADTVCIIDNCLYHYVLYPDSLNTGATNCSKYFEYVKYAYFQLRDRLKPYCEKDQQLLLNLEQYISYEIINGINKYGCVKSYYYLFPYELIEQRSKIILYGAGCVGRNFYKQLMRNKYCDIVLWVDRRLEDIDVSYANIEDPAKIVDMKGYDYIIVAVDNKLVADDIRLQLENMCIDGKKIIWKAGYLAELEVEF